MAPRRSLPVCLLLATLVLVLVHFPPHAAASAIADAINGGDTTALAKAIVDHKQSGEVDALDHFGFRPLHTAASNGCLACVALLLDQGGAAIDAKTGKETGPQHEGETALMLAASGPRGSQAHTAVARALLERGADRTATSRAGYTALHFAASFAHLEIVTMLLHQGSEGSQGNMGGASFVGDGARNRLSVAVTAEALSARTAVLDLMTKDGRRKRVGARATPLHLAAMSRNNSKVVRKLLAHGADAAARDRIGGTPLHLTFSSGDVDAARVLLEADATLVLIQDQNEQTPLDQAHASFHRKAITEATHAALKALHGEFVDAGKAARDKVLGTAEQAEAKKGEL